jgi:Na+/H+-dicarboxylate symporter
MMILPTIESFSKELQKYLFLPILFISIFLIVVSIFLGIKDKEIIHTITDERTKKVDKYAGYYSWWITVFFIFVAGIIAEIFGLSIYQLIYLIFSEMLLTLLLLHMYFNFKGKF